MKLILFALLAVLTFSCSNDRPDDLHFGPGPEDEAECFQEVTE